MNILNLFARIGLKADTAQANQFLKGVTSIKNELKGAMLGALSFSTAIKSIGAAIQQSAQLERFSAETGASTTALQKWQYVANRVSGSGEAVAASIKAIVSNQEKIKLGQGNISGYQLLGIDPRSNPFQVMQQIADKTRNMSAGMRRNILSMFGVSSELTATLSLTNKQFSQMAQHAYVISPQMIQGMNRARSAMEQVKNATTYFIAELATKASPVIEKFSVILQRVIRFFIQGVEQISLLIQNTIGLRTALIALVAVLAVMNAEFLLSPLGLFTVGIIALMAVLQDLAAYSAGKKSFFGFLMEKFPGLQGPLKTTLMLFTAFGNALKGMLTGDWSNLNKFIDSLDKQRPGLEALANLLMAIEELWKRTSGHPIVGTVKAYAEELKKVAVEKNAHPLQTLGENFSKLGNWIFKGGPAPWDQSAKGNVTVTQNIYGSNDPVATGNAAASALQPVLNAGNIHITGPAHEATSGRPK